MSVMRALDEAEYVYTGNGKKRATHEAYSFLITPFAYPPIKVLVYKGHIDQRGIFQALDVPRDIIITQDEFKELIRPDSHGKPAGDFRLSDILRCLKKRHAPKESRSVEPDPQGGSDSNRPNAPLAYSKPSKSDSGSA